MNFVSLILGSGGSWMKMLWGQTWGQSFINNLNSFGISFDIRIYFVKKTDLELWGFLGGCLAINFLINALLGFLDRKHDFFRNSYRFLRLF